MLIIPTFLRSSVPFFAVALLAAACGSGGGGGPSTVKGTISGKTFTPADTISGAVDFGTSSALAVVLSSFADTCTVATDKESVKNAGVMAIVVANIDSTTRELTAPTAAGKFTVVPVGGSFPAEGGVATGGFDHSDASCNSSGHSNFVSGTITIDKVDSSGVSGTADVKLDSGDSITVSFDGTNCAAMSNVFSVPDPTCK